MPSADNRITNNSNDGANYQYAQIYVDVNGANRGLHKLGDDIFAFRVMKYGDIKPYVKDDNVSSFSFSDCRSNGLLCTAWAMKYGNMDYLKTDNNGKCSNNTSVTLSWNGNHSCSTKR